MSFMESAAKFFSKIFGSRNDRLIKSTYQVIEQINSLEAEFQKLSDGQMKEYTDKLKQKLKDGKTTNDILPEAFALVREASKRYLGMRHFDVQLVGGYYLHHGKIVEMVTGEGKTLVATMPAYLNALTGKGVHIVTVNDYLAQRDRDLNAPLFEGLGLKVGVIQSQMDPWDRKDQYACDITYGMNNEFGFDYLRDNMKMDIEEQCQGELHYAIIDEVDSILIDEARTPLIISGPSEKSTDIYYKAYRVSKKLKKGRDYSIKEKEKSVLFTEEGMERAEREAGVGPLYSGGNGLLWPHALDNALSALEFYKRDKNYVVEGGEVIIIDEFTGRKMDGRTWSDGLHQAIEAKEGLKVKEENQTLATITFQNYFRLYDKLSGMTGTAMTEAVEFDKIYKLDVVDIPTNRPLIRDNKADRIYGTLVDKKKAFEEEIVSVHGAGRPILVGTVSIESSEELSNIIQQRGLPHEVLNAKHEEKEAVLVARAGELGSVTVATNMAGRGTDIRLGTFTKQELLDFWKEWGVAPKKLRLEDSDFWERITNHWKKSGWLEKWEYSGIALDFEVDGKKYRGMPLCTSVKELGGLHIVGTERHEARRVDNQLRGRCGRQGDPGSSRFFLSLEDELMRIFYGDWVRNVMQRMGLKEGQDISHPMVSRGIEKAQKRVEGHNFDIRKHLLDYDGVMDEQRTIIYNERQSILRGDSLKPKITGWIGDDVDGIVNTYMGPDVEEELRDPEAVAAQVFNKYGLMADMDKYKVTEEEYKDVEDLVPHLVEIIEQFRWSKVEKEIIDHLENKLGRDVEATKPQRNQIRNWANQNYKLEIESDEIEHLWERPDLESFILSRAEEMDIHALPEEDKTKLQEMVEKKFATKRTTKICNDIREWLYKKYNVIVLLSSFYSRYPLYDELEEKITQLVLDEYENREKELGHDDMRRLESYITLQKIDEKWKDHLRAMDELKSSIGMRGYGQEDPKIAYKREGYAMFREMQASLREEVTDLILKLTISREDEMDDMYGMDDAQAIHEEFHLQQQAAEQAMDMASSGPAKPLKAKQQVGRNEPCHCGSGKKYKFCCGE